MYLSQEAVIMPYCPEEDTDNLVLRDLVELVEKEKYCCFLKKEFDTSQTGAEKEVILLELIETEVQIHEIEERLNLPKQLWAI